MAILKEIALDFLVASGFFPMCHQSWREGRLALELALLTTILLDLVMGEGGTEGLSCLEQVSKESFDVNLVVPRSHTHDGSYQTNKNKPRSRFVTLYKKFHFLGGTFYIPKGSPPPPTSFYTASLLVPVGFGQRNRSHSIYPKYTRFNTGDLEAYITDGRAG